VEGSYAPGELVTYVITIRNTGTAAFTGLTVTDDLGGGANALLTYEAGTALYFANGVLQAAPTVTAGPPLVFTGITVPGNGDAVIVYQARANSFAAPGVDGTITNTVTITGGGLTAPVTATETVNAAIGPDLSITKTITPAQVADNGRVTYTFLIQNSGNQPITAADAAAINDVFDPILTDLVVTFNGTVLAEGTGYTYNAATGQFDTVPGVITVPAATYTQTPDGQYTTTPGIATLTVTGTI
jgi:archaellum component FlaG (FlaF/FlaG flagellin family)